jgi:hypothetical protein
MMKAYIQDWALKVEPENAEDKKALYEWSTNTDAHFVMITVGGFNRTMVGIGKLKMLLDLGHHEGEVIKFEIGMDLNEKVE